MFGFYSFSHGNLFTIVESVILLSRYCYFLQSRLVNIRCLSSIVVSSVDYKRIDEHTLNFRTKEDVGSLFEI